MDVRTGGKELRPVHLVLLPLGMRFGQDIGLSFQVEQAVVRQGLLAVFLEQKVTNDEKPGFDKNIIGCGRLEPVP